MRRCVLAAIVHALLAVSASVTLAGPTIVEITACDVFLETGERGVLQNDIHCEAGRIGLQVGAQLDLNGFTITKTEDDFNATPSHEEAAVFCLRQCEVFSSSPAPGRILGPGNGVLDELVGIEGAGYYDGPIGTRRMRVENVEIGGFDYGIYAQLARIYLYDVNVHDTEWGIESARVTLEGGTLTENYFGVLADRINGRDITCTDNEFRCISAEGVRLEGIDASGSATAVFGTRVRIQDGTLSDNTVDIAAHKLPRISNTSCETSFVPPPEPPGTWGICTND